MIDKACSDCEDFIITTKDNKVAVLMSFEEYSSIKETMYLLGSANNRVRLMDAVSQIEVLEYKTRELDI